MAFKLVMLPPQSDITRGWARRLAATLPEVEGIDASHTASGFLHTLTNEPLQATSWVDEFTVTGP